MSNCALVRILVLRFVIPYASTKVNSYAMKFISYLWCIIQCYLCLMLGYEIFCFLFGRFSIFLLAFILHWVWSLLVHPKPFKPVLPYESIIPTYMRYFHAVLSKFACVISNFQNKFLFCVLVQLARRWGVANIFHARCVILTMSVYSLVIAWEYDKGIRDAQHRNEKWFYFMLSNNKFLGKC